MSYNIHPLTPVELRLRTDLGSHGDTGNEVHAKIDRLKNDTTAILADTADMQPKLGTPAGSSISADIAAIKAVVDANGVDTDSIISLLQNGTYGLSALDTQLNAIEADTQDIQTKIGSPAGASVSADIAAVKAVVDTINTNTDSIEATLGTPSNGSVSADIAAIESIVSGIQNNTRTTIAMQDEMEQQASNTYYKLILSNYDSAGNMEAPDSAPTVAVETFGGVSRSANLFEDGDGTDTALTAGAMVNDGTGVYYVFYKVGTGHAVNEGLVFEFTVVEGGLTRTMTRTSRVVEEISSTFTASDRSNLADILADTSDIQPKIGSPVTSVSADIAAVKAVVDAIEVDTQAIETDTQDIQSTLSTTRNKDGGLTFDQATDSLEAISEAIAALSASASKPQAVQATKTSGSIAQAANELVVLGLTEGVTSEAMIIKEIRCVPTTQTSSNFTVEVFEDAAATISLLKFEKANSTKGDLRLAVDLLFINQNGTPSKNVYVKITNVADSSSSVFNVEVRGFEAALPA